MRVIADYGLAARRTPPSFIAPRSRVGVRPTLPRWGCTAALVVGLPVLLVNPAGRDHEELAQLERLVPKVERAHTLSPDATQTISRLIERQSVVGGAGNQSHQMRRKAAIERLIRAMQAKQDNSPPAPWGPP
ncbi:MAG: hypothetical protein QOI46_4570 [Alphaproteobacteria bacterium]|nr:hypothetical protein [Alphaproteobacteria bacterium]